MVIFSKNENESIDLGYKLGLLLENPSTILLEGDLGAGKTTFTKGIGKALGVEKTINSPTFTIMKCYKGKYPLYHLDLYRLNGVNQEFDLEEYIDSGIAVIEWPHQADELLPKEYLRIIITIEDDKRKFEFIPVGEKYEKLMEVARFE
jgi:tRNA threonylcarbamoyladenosine biosynthesis protein TsaE